MVGDEINRASPKTQSALLECMEERQVTVDGITYPLDPPFMVIATQNPVEMEGTYPLPEAQRDRFTARIALGYPSIDAELMMIDTHSAASPLDDLEPVSDNIEVAKLVSAVRTVHIADSVRRYAVDLVTATRNHPDLRLGASPRATLHLLRAGRATAALDERDYVAPDDLQALADAGALAPAAALRRGPDRSSHHVGSRRRHPRERSGAGSRRPPTGLGAGVPSFLRGALRSLTMRGRCLLAAGVTDRARRLRPARARPAPGGRAADRRSAAGGRTSRPGPGSG